MISYSWMLLSRCGNEVIMDQRLYEAEMNNITHKVWWGVVEPKRFLQQTHNNFTSASNHPFFDLTTHVSCNIWLFTDMQFTNNVCIFVNLSTLLLSHEAHWPHTHSLLVVLRMSSFLKCEKLHLYFSVLIYTNIMQHHVALHRAIFRWF